MNEKNFQFPDSPQSDLFNLLKPEQREYIQPILRVLKKDYQIYLCAAIIVYLESGFIDPPRDRFISAVFRIIIEEAKINPLDSRTLLS